ncbi:TPA: hypothetical protein IAA82_00305 [Candidatus Galligastranaerophilus gallistercoris]|nr:hypothetical protein [Candidatus Galligastranaerophilus gallistercoris]
MENIEKLLKKIEFNYHNKDKKETAEFKINDETYNVLLLNRSEKANLIFSRQNGEFNNLKEIYEWLKPVIYKSFQLKEAAVEAKERGFIKSYYDVVDMLFEPSDIIKIIEFLLKANNLQNFKNEELAFEKKQ